MRSRGVFLFLLLVCVVLSILARCDARHAAGNTLCSTRHPRDIWREEVPNLENPDTSSDRTARRSGAQHRDRPATVCYAPERYRASLDRPDATGMSAAAA